MDEFDKYWVVGYKPNASFIIIGLNTGSYSKLPSTYEEAIKIKGHFLYFKNIRNEGEEDLQVSPVMPKVPFLDDLLRLPNADDSFDHFEDALRAVLRECLIYEKLLSEVPTDIKN